MQNKKKDNSINIDLSLIFLLIIIVGGVIAVFLFFSDNDNEYTEVDEVVADLAVECERGEWVEFPVDETQSEKFLENAEFSGFIIEAGMEDDEMTNDVGDEDIIFTTHPEYSLIFYDGRDVEIAGKYIESKDAMKQVYVNKIRCIGSESNMEIKADRSDILSFITENKNEIFALSKEKSDNIEIEDISFIDEKNVAYVFFTENSDDENSLDVLMLLRFDGEDRDFEMEKLAEYKLEEGKLLLIDGEDKYRQVKKTTYEYDDEDGWILAW